MKYIKLSIKEIREYNFEYNFKIFMQRLRLMRVPSINNILKQNRTDLFELKTQFLDTHSLCYNCKEYFKKSGSNFCNSKECQEAKIKSIENKSIKTKIYNNSLNEHEKQSKIEKAKQSKLLKYGNENYNNIEKQKQTFKNKSQSEIKLANEKRNSTKLLKYGLMSYNNSNKIKESLKQRFLKDKDIILNKIKQSKFLKYGSENYNNIEKHKTTIKEKYGVENISRIDFVKQKKSETFLKNYGTSNYFSTNEFKNYIKRLNECKYGVSYHTQKHIKNRDDLTPEGLAKFIDSKHFDMEKCLEHFGFNYSSAQVYKKLFNINAPNKSNKAQSQTSLFNLIKIENKIKNARSVLNKKELDIYLPGVKLAVEYNGLLYHSQGISKYSKFTSKTFDYHLNKTLECESKGIQLFHIFEGEDLDLWLSMIHNKLGINKKIYARDCIIKEIKSFEIVNFLNENHIQGYANAKICLGLYYNKSNKTISEAENCVKCVRQGDLLAVMTFSKPRFNKGYEYELIRFCSLKHHNILGAASKLFKYFIKKYNPKSIISYAICLKTDIEEFLIVEI